MTTIGVFAFRYHWNKISERGEALVYLKVHYDESQCDKGTCTLGAHYNSECRWPGLIIKFEFQSTSSAGIGHRDRHCGKGDCKKQRVARTFVCSVRSIVLCNL